MPLLLAPLSVRRWLRQWSGAHGFPSDMIVAMSGDEVIGDNSVGENPRGGRDRTWRNKSRYSRRGEWATWAISRPDNPRPRLRPPLTGGNPRPPIRTKTAGSQSQLALLS